MSPLIPSPPPPPIKSYERTITAAIITNVHHTLLLIPPFSPHPDIPISMKVFTE